MTTQEQKGPSRIVRWTMPDGTTQERRYERNVRETALWKIYLLGAVLAICFDDYGNETVRFNPKVA